MELRIRIPGTGIDDVEAEASTETSEAKEAHPLLDACDWIWIPASAGMTALRQRKNRFVCGENVVTRRSSQ